MAETFHRVSCVGSTSTASCHTSRLASPLVTDTLSGHGIPLRLSQINRQRVPLRRKPQTAQQPGQPDSQRSQPYDNPQQVQQGSQPATGSRDDYQAAATVHLPNIPRPVPPRAPPALAWMPPQLLTHLQSLAGFLAACWAVLPEFVSPSLSEATRRLCLVLGASLVMVVLVSTIDSGWLYLYLLNARRGVAVAV